MLIDFHTHIFPDKVAPKAVGKLSELIHQKPSHDGTYAGLAASASKAGIHISVVLPVVTDPKQFDSVLRFACEVNERFYKNEKKGLFSFAGIHPESEDYKGQLKLIKEYGFVGFKIHPDYQGCTFDDIRYQRILARASELDLLTVTHAGFDVYSPEKVHCTVPMIRKVLRDVRPGRLVLAHMGNNVFYEDVEEHLLGADVYIDTAYSIEHVDPDHMCRMIRKHGAEKVLFASDAPWADQAKAVEMLGRIGLTEEEYELVSHKNALHLLNL